MFELWSAAAEMESTRVVRGGVVVVGRVKTAEIWLQIWAASVAAREASAGDLVDIGMGCAFTHGGLL